MADPYLETLLPVVIAAGQSLSPEVDVGGFGVLVGLVVPAAWTTAGISFQCSANGGANFGEVLDATSGNLTIASLAGGAAHNVAIDPARFRAIRAIKVRSGTVGTPVNQVSQVAVQLVLRQIS